MAFSVVKIRITSKDPLQGRIYTHYNSPNDYLIEITGEDLAVELTRPRIRSGQSRGALAPNISVVNEPG